MGLGGRTAMRREPKSRQAAAEALSSVIHPALYPAAMDDVAYAYGLPKAELHLHIEGTLEPELMLTLAKRNQLPLPFPDVATARAAYDFHSLQPFLDLYYRGASVLVTEQDFHDLAAAYLEKAHAHGVRRVEMFFDPETHTHRGVPFSTVIGGLTAALDEAEERWGISSDLIMCFLRHLPASDALRTLEEAAPYRDAILGVGLDSSEVGHPPAKFVEVFAGARDLGWRITAHAGEEGPPGYVWEALDVLGAERIDHGVRSLEDAALVRRLAADRVPLTVCPLSNVKLRVVDTLADHPLPRMLEARLLVSVNSDDPSYFGGYVGDNYAAVAADLGLSRADLAGIARDSFASSFLDEAAQAALVAEVDAFADAHA